VEGDFKGSGGVVLVSGSLGAKGRRRPPRLRGLSIRDVGKHGVRHIKPHPRDPSGPVGGPFRLGTSSVFPGFERSNCSLRLGVPGTP